jgi:hypothetical protein
MEAHKPLLLFNFRKRRSTDAGSKTFLADPYTNKGGCLIVEPSYARHGGPCSKACDNKVHPCHSSRSPLGARPICGEPVERKRSRRAVCQVRRYRFSPANDQARGIGRRREGPPASRNRGSKLIGTPRGHGIGIWPRASCGTPNAKALSQAEPPLSCRNHGDIAAFCHRRRIFEGGWTGVEQPKRAGLGYRMATQKATERAMISGCVAVPMPLDVTHRAAATF